MAIGWEGFPNGWGGDLDFVDSPEPRVLYRMGYDIAHDWPGYWTRTPLSVLNGLLLEEGFELRSACSNNYDIRGNTNARGMLNYFRDEVRISVLQTLGFYKDHSPPLMEQRNYIECATKHNSKEATERVLGLFFDELLDAPEDDENIRITVPLL